ncbi:MAG TPA: carboxylesterase [Gammaproteobacteria bacterium]|nr:carboxylesterase [Gammaproteobacteria bacterium]
MLEMLEIDPPGEVCGSVIWLHGLGADGHDFEPLLREWDLSARLGVRFVLPHAPVRPVTLNAGARMRAWYDIRDLSLTEGEDIEGIEAARGQIVGLLEAETRRGIPRDRLVLAGFSQGGALSLYTALRMEAPPAAVLGLSCYLPLRERLAQAVRARPGTLAIRIDHGDQDPVVPLAAAERARDAIAATGHAVEFHVWPMAHSLCPPQIDSLHAWLVARFGA